MRVLLTKLYSTLLGVMLTTCAFAQLTGTKNIPGDYANLATAITTLNAQGVGAGGVTINLIAGNPQTAPAGGYAITATGTAANPIIFQGNNNIITAATGLTAGSLTDALIKIGGGDYITINNFQLRDNVANNVFATAATNTMTEFGIVVSRLSTTDGAKNNTISNCNIQLRQGGAYTSTIGIYSNSRHDYNTASYATTVTGAAGGENSNNTFRNNTISGVTSGIVIIGNTAVFDTDNTVGGTAGQGNNITIGPNTAGPLTTFAGYTTARMDGVFMQNPVSCIVNYNTIVNNGSTFASAGIYLSGTSGTAVFTNTTNNNNITLTSTNTGTCYGIYNSSGNTSSTLLTNNNTVSVTTNGTLYGIYMAAGNSVNTMSGNDVTVVNNGTTGTLACIYNSVANGTLTISGNTQNMSTTGVTSGTLYFTYNGSTQSVSSNILNNTYASPLGITSTGTNYLIYHSNATLNSTITGNVTSGTISRTGSGGTVYTYYNFASPGSGVETISNNNFSNISVTGATLFYGCRSGTSVNHAKVVNNNIFNNITTGTGNSVMMSIDYMNAASEANNNKINNFTAEGNVWGFNFGNSSTLGGVGISTKGNISGNKVANISSSGASSTVTGIFMSPAVAGSMVFSNDTVINASSSGTTAPIVRGIHMYGGINDSLYNCYVAGITTTAGAGSAVVNGIAMGGGTLNAPTVYNNNVNAISAGTSAGTTTQAMGINAYGGINAVNIYNNFVSNISAPSASNSDAVVGINIANSAANGVYFNTIKLGATGTPVTSTGTDFGATGLLFTTSGTTDAKNNIINVNATATGTGIVAAARRFNAAGAPGVAPTNYSGGSNVFYVNTGANNYLFAEGTLASNVVNGYAMSGLTASVANNIVNDANFNTACGLYKSFMGGEENATTSENNLVAGTVTGTFTPSGASFAQNSAIAITSPLINFDNSGAVRSATPDGGAKEFTGAASDVAAPNIAYTDLTNTFCTGTAPALVATITDGSGVNVTAGTRPRLYYKKLTEANVFGTYPGNNVAGFNGWKYVESTNSGNTHTFNMNYALLTSAVATGDVIQYFVAAQDLNSTPNVGLNAVGLAAGYCPSSVNLPPAAGPTAAIPAISSFTIDAIPSFATATSMNDLCVSGSTTITLTPAVLNGSTIQWQHDNYTNNFTDISGANAATYVTPVITDTMQYRAQIYCGATLIATSAAVAVNVNNPAISTAIGDTICPNTTATLTATSNSGSLFSWYANPVGGTALATGATFVTPSLSTTTDYYVSAATGVSGDVGKTSYTSTDGSNTGGYLKFNALVPFVLNSVVFHPVSSTSASGTVTIALQSSTGVTIQSVTVPVTGSPVGTPSPQTIPLNFNVPIGTDLRLTMVSYTGITGGLREYTAGAGITFPYTLPGVASITDGSLAGYYYFFYNWSVSSGCEGTRTQVTATVTNPPTATLASTSTICQGDQGDVDITFTGYGPWDFTYSDGVTTNNVTGITANPYTLTVTPPAPNTMYSLTALSDNICAANPVNLTSTAVVNTHAQPTATLGGTQTVCDGTPVYVFLGLSGAAPWTYTLYDGTTYTSQTTSAPSSNLLVSPTGNTTYSITALSDANCTATTADITNDATITLNPRAEATFSVSGADTVCSGSPANVDVNFTGTAPWTFEYNDGFTNTPVTTSSNPYTVTTPLTATTTYSINYLLDNNCISLPPDYVSTFTMNVDNGPTISSQPSDINACSGSANSFTVAAEGWGVSYQWYMNGTPMTDGGVYTGTGTGTLSISDITGLSSNTYYAVATGNCTPVATSATVNITESFSTTWNGSVNTLWSVPQNWSCGSIPNAFTDVIIPSAAINMPEVDIPGAICHSITVDAGSSVTFINPGSQLEVLADITNNGVFNATGGIVVLSGNTPQSFPGATYDELHILGGSTKTITGDVTINNEIEFGNGNLNLGNNNLLLGTATITGGSAASYAVTTGTGSMKIGNMGAGGNTGAVTFHVGSGSYTPVTLTNDGTTDNFSVRVMPNVFVDGDGTSPATVDNAVVNRTWMISEDVAGGSDVTMTPQWNDAEHINGFDITHVYVAHYINGGWVNEFGGASITAPAAVGTDPYTTTQAGISTFSPFTVASTAGFPLAIKMKSISATNVKDKNRVNWSTATEDAGDKFVVEQSADAKSFIEIGKVDAKGTPSDYIFWDEHPYVGTTYYRVKMLSGNSGTYSSVVYAMMNATNNFSLSAYPNPVTDKVIVQASGSIEGDASIVITDASGKVVKSAKLENGLTEVSMDGLAAGMYLIKYSDKVNHESIKITKQ